MSGINDLSSRRKGEKIPPAHIFPSIVDVPSPNMTARQKKILLTALSPKIVIVLNDLPSIFTRVCVDGWSKRLELLEFSPMETHV